jgi:hypothetical protein
MGERLRHAAIRPVQFASGMGDRDPAVAGMLIIAGIVGDVMAGPRVRPPRRLPRLPIDVELLEEFAATLAMTVEPGDRLPAARPVEDVMGENFRNGARVAICEHTDADAAIGQHRHQRIPAEPAAAVADNALSAIAVRAEAETIMRIPDLGEFGCPDVYTRRLKLLYQGRRQYPLSFKFAFVEMKAKPVREACNRGVDAARGRRANRQEVRAPADIPIHRVRRGGVSGGGEIFRRECHVHVQPVGQPGAGKFGPALTADAFSHHACDEIAEIVILEGAAKVLARLQITQRRQHLRGRQVGGHVNPVVPRQPGMVAEQIANGDAVGGDGVMQPEFRDVVPHRLVPVKAPLVHQNGEARGGERFRDRADRELRASRHLQAGLDIAEAIGADQRRLPVLHHRDGEARNLPLVHRFRDETFEAGNEGRNGFAVRDRLGAIGRLLGCNVASTSCVSALNLAQGDE